MEPPKHTHPKNLWEHIRTGLYRAHKRRPTSFYLLLLVPLVLYLGAVMGQYLDRPLWFATILGLLFLFFGIIVLHAIRDVFHITRKNLREHRDSYTDTLGDTDFIHELAERIKKEKEQEK